MLTRRTFLTASGAGLAAGALISTPATASLLTKPLGVQLFTLRAELEIDFAATLGGISRLGYRELEFAGFFGHAAADIRRVTDSLGLRCVGAHHAAADLESKLPEIIEFATALGLTHINCSSPKSRDPDRVKDLSWGQRMAALDLDDWKSNAELFNRVGGELQRADIQLGYHNHHVEFRRIGNVVVYDELLRWTDPRLVKMQLDCGWAVAAGADPVAYLKRYPGRFTSLHLKDIVAVPPAGQADSTVTTEVGRGIIDWKSILRAAEKAGVAGYYVEQEPPFLRPPLESLAISYQYLSQLQF
jgi:sugar phosphate isomerase/epimerase